MKKLFAALVLVFTSTSASAATTDVLIAVLSDASVNSAVAGASITNIEETASARCMGCFQFEITAYSAMTGPYKLAVSTRGKFENGGMKVVVNSVTRVGDSPTSNEVAVEGDVPADLVKAIVSSDVVVNEVGPVLTIKLISQQRCPGCFRLKVIGQSIDMRQVAEVQSRLNMGTRQYELTIVNPTAATKRPGSR